MERKVEEVQAMSQIQTCDVTGIVDSKVIQNRRVFPGTSFQYYFGELGTGGGLGGGRGTMDTFELIL